MTTHEVMVALVQAGWRAERLGAGLAPVLTNTPAGQQFCAYCGSYVRERDYRPAASRCVTCARAREAERWAQRPTAPRRGASPQWTRAYHAYRRWWERV